MPDESINPYASPTVSTPLPPEPEPERGSYRMSEASLKTAIRLMILSEVAFAAGWLFFIAAMFVPLIIDDIMVCGSISGFLVAWVLITILMIHCRGIGMLMIALMVPLPFLGSLAFLACINHTRQTLILNGYAPGFLGGKPDEAERAMMDENLFYLPSLKFDIGGEKRNLRSALTHILLVIMALGFIALMGLS